MAASEKAAAEATHARPSVRRSVEIEDVEDVEEVASRKRASETIHITSGSSSSGGEGSRCGSDGGAEDLEEESAEQELGE